MERNIPVHLKKIHCFEQLAVYSALYLGSIVSDLIIYSVERVLMHSQNKLQQRKIRYIITKTCSGFIPQSTSVNQVVSSDDSQTC